MRTNSIVLALGICAVVALSASAPAQRKSSRSRTTSRVAKKSVSSGAETGLAGIKLYDTGTKLVSVYGSPDEIEAVTLGGSTAGPSGGAAGGSRGGALPGGMGRPGGPGAVGGGGGSPGPAGTPLPPGSGADLHSPDAFGFGDQILGGQLPDMQSLPGKPGGGSRGGGAGLAPAGAAAGGGPGPMGGGGMGGGSNGGEVDYTRWVYNRSGVKYGFILDKFNHIVQCEAVGISAGKARTRRGITFGSSVAQIIKAYGAPDGYEFDGSNIVIRYLSRAKCAFRLSKLGQDKPDVVTGIVVAAGKR